MRAIRAFVLLGIGLALAYVAGWGMAGTELSLPAALAAFGAVGLAVA
jgi:hypothetical protein